MEDGSFAFVIGIIALICLGAGSYLHSTLPMQIKTKKPLSPELNIVIKDGVSDTTYIYMEPTK